MRRLFKIAGGLGKKEDLFVRDAKCKGGASLISRRFWSGVHRLRATDGVELLEFGLALPILLVVVIGIIDFASAYNTKHVMSNAAREAARLIVSTPLSDSSCPSGWDPASPASGTPCPVKAAAISVANYMTDAGLNTASCLSTASPTYSSLLTWTYSCSNVKLVINKAYVIPNSSGGYSISGTHVTLQYPYTFIFGRIVGLLSILHIAATGPS